MTSLREGKFQQGFWLFSGNQQIAVSSLPGRYTKVQSKFFLLLNLYQVARCLILFNKTLSSQINEKYRIKFFVILVFQEH